MSTLNAHKDYAPSRIADAKQLIYKVDQMSSELSPTDAQLNSALSDWTLNARAIAEEYSKSDLWLADAARVESAVSGFATASYEVQNICERVLKP